jgi:ribonuclease P/MRP protein subunit POP5
LLDRKDGSIQESVSELQVHFNSPAKLDASSYMLLQIKSEKNIKVSQAEIADNFKKSVLRYYGDFGAASIANFGVKYFNEKHKLVIVRVSHGPHRFLSSILPLLTTVSHLTTFKAIANSSLQAGKELARYRILYIGATIRQCKKHIVKHQNEFLRQTVGNFKDETERKDVLENLVKNLDD